MNEVEYNWYSGIPPDDSLVEECARLFSAHYGRWSTNSNKRPGEPIHISTTHISKLLKQPGAVLAEARLGTELIGYTIGIQGKIQKKGNISWVTQLVVHERHRRQGIGKELLYCIWSNSRDFAWGLVSSNPYAIRALEKATRRRCDPSKIAKNYRAILNFGATRIYYINKSSHKVIRSNQSVLDTDFHVDHSDLPNKITNVSSTGTPWQLGNLPDGYEWFAFTFKDQEQIMLTSTEMKHMLETSDQLVKRAYSRMRINPSQHSWAKHTKREIDFIKDACHLQPGSTLLDLGCGSGRHASALAKTGLHTLGVDYVHDFIKEARKNAVPGEEYECSDIRSLDLGRIFDAVICLYDVIGSFIQESDNLKILRTMALHLKPEGYALLSVMNMELTEHQGQSTFSLSESPNALLDLPSSTTMEQTGNIFDPKYYMIDTDEGVVYRRERFERGHLLPQELIVRDKRFRQKEIERMCQTQGLKVLWSRFVQAGRWEIPLKNTDPKAKEILVLCQKQSCPNS